MQRLLMSLRALMVLNNLIVLVVDGVNLLSHWGWWNINNSYNGQVYHLNQSNHNSEASFEVVFLLFDFLELKVCDDHADVIPAELEVWQVAYFRRVLFVTIVLLPPRLALVYQRKRYCLFLFVLVDKSAYFRRAHHIPAAVRPDHDKFIGFFQNNVLNLRIWN